MAEEFKAITTQEEFDAAIGKRLEREREKIRAEFKDYDTIKASNDDLKKSIDAFKAEKATWQTKFDGLEKENTALKLDSLKTEACLAAKLPIEMRSRLSGEDADALKADAEALAKFVTAPYTAPLRRNEPHEGNSTEAAYRALAESLGRNN